MYRLTLILTLLVLHPLTALSLKDKLSNGSSGDYIITEQNHLCSLIRIHTLAPPILVIEEISFPQTMLPTDLSTWLQSGANGHTSWSLLEIHLPTNTFKRCFSFTKDTWLLTHPDDSFLIKILDMTLNPVPEHERRRIGPPPTEGLDTRKIWNPPLVFQTKKDPTPQFTAYQFVYPKDGSPLAGKRIELFFNEAKENFPFPYWGQITDDSGAALKFRVIDSGQNLSSPKKYPL